MNILCIAQVEDRTNLDEQIKKQTVQPDRVVFYIDENPADGVIERRKRIAENHAKLRAIVEAYKPDLVWQLEQDSVLPEDCLERLIQRYKEGYGYISGIEVGRHGLYCIGAWLFNRDGFESVDHNLKGIQPVNATGFYCLLTSADTWLSGICEWNNEPYGPDVVWCLSLPVMKYVDMGLEIGHKVKGGVIWPHHMSTCNVQFYKNDEGEWKFKQL